MRVADFRGQKVQVTGEVAPPSTVPITDVPLRVQDAIAQAKGLTQEADQRAVTLTRGGKTFTLDVQALYEQGDLRQNWLLQDGDILNVPDRSRNKVFVLGEVRRPSSRVMVKGRMTLAEAIGDSEGFDPADVEPVEGLRHPRQLRPRPPSTSSMPARPTRSCSPPSSSFSHATSSSSRAHDLTRWNRIISQIQPTVQSALAGGRNRRQDHHLAAVMTSSSSGRKASARTSTGTPPDDTLDLGAPPGHPARVPRVDCRHVRRLTLLGGALYMVFATPI